MARLGSVALAVLLLGGWLHAQVGEPLYSRYRNAVVAYQRGDFDGAARTINSWSIQDLHSVVRFALGPEGDGVAGPGAVGFASEHIGGPTPEAAAMLHTEIVLRGQATRTVPASVQLELAELLIRGMERVRQPTAPIDREETLQFQQRWYVLVASIFISNTGPQAAEPWLARGAALSRRDGRLAGAQAWIDLMSGVAFEMAAHLLDPECRRPSCEAGSARSQMPGRLVFAKSAYLRALERDASLTEARLRLGRVNFLRNDREGAALELRRALAGATTVRQRYLGHLFLGELAQVEKNFPLARREYEAARAVGPEFQSSHVAIGFIAQLTGDSDALRESAAAAARSDPPERDPWWGYQNGTGDEETLAWLRARVLR